MSLCLLRSPIALKAGPKRQSIQADTDALPKGEIAHRLDVCACLCAVPANCHLVSRTLAQAKAKACLSLQQES